MDQVRLTTGGNSVVVEAIGWLIREPGTIPHTESLIIGACQIFLLLPVILIQSIGDKQDHRRDHQRREEEDCKGDEDVYLFFRFLHSGS